MINSEHLDYLRSQTQATEQEGLSHKRTTLKLVLEDVLKTHTNITNSTPETLRREENCARLLPRNELTYTSKMIRITAATKCGRTSRCGFDTHSVRLAINGIAKRIYNCCTILYKVYVYNMCMCICSNVCEIEIGKMT